MGRFLEKLVGAPEVKLLLSDEHFSVDGTLLQACGSGAYKKTLGADKNYDTKSFVA